MVPTETVAEVQPPGTSTTDYNKQQFPPVPQLHEPIKREHITLPEDLQYRYLQQEQKQLQRKHRENIKGGHTNPDISQLHPPVEALVVPSESNQAGTGSSTNRFNTF